MNLDFKLPLTGAVARKLAYASTIMKVDVDAKIIRHVNDDMLTSDEVHKHVRGTTLDSPISALILGVVQFVADSGYRAIIGAETLDQSRSLLLYSALASGKNLLIVDRYKVGGHSHWQFYLKQQGIPFVDASNAQDGIDLTARVMVHNENTNMEYLLKHARDRVLVYSHHIDQSFFDINDLFANGAEQSQFNLADACMDFEFVVMAFHTKDHTGPSKQDWYSSMGFTTLASCLWGDNKLIKAVGKERASQKLLNDSGIMLTSPHHIAKLLNVNVDVLRATEAAYDNWADSLAQSKDWGPASSQD